MKLEYANQHLYISHCWTNLYKRNDLTLCTPTCNPVHFSAI